MTTTQKKDFSKSQLTKNRAMQTSHLKNNGEAVFQADTGKLDILQNYGWKNFVENNPEGFQIADPDTGSIVYINPAGARTYGAYHPEEIIGSSVDSLIEFKNYENVHDRIAQLREGQKPEITLHEVIGIDGMDRFVEIDSKSVIIQGKRYIQTFLRDVTMRERIRIKNLKISKEKELLLQEVHHRVKNNLAIISGFISLYEMESDDQKFTSKLRKIQFRIQVLAGIYEVLYQDKDFSSVNFVQCLWKAVELFSAKTIVKFSVESEKPVYLNINEAITVLQLTSELLISHEKLTDIKGEIIILIEQTDNVTELKINHIHSGIGMPLFRVNNDGISSSLIHSYVQQLDASVKKVDTHEDQRLSIRFLTNTKKKGIGNSFDINLLI